MKRSRIVFTSLLALTLGAGVFAGVSFGQNNAKEVAADIGVNYGNSGKIFLQLNTSEWKSSSSKIGLYMFNNSVSKSAWGGYVTPSGTSRFVEYSYNLDFTPAQCIAFRMAPDAPAMGSWCWENDRGSDYIYSTTNDTDFDNVVWLGNYYPSSKWTESGAYNLDAVVKGGASDDWSVATVNQQLTDVKVNGSDNLEVYGKITFTGSTYFKVVKGGSDWCGGYTAHSSISSNLETSASGNIHVKSAATYEIYFDYDGETSYITDPVLAEVDEWSQYFLNNVHCDATSATLPSGWGVCATEYGKLSDDAKDLVYGASASGAGYVNQAVARYDLAITRHPSLTKFIVNHSGTPRSAAVITAPTIIESTNKTSSIITVVIVSVAALTAIGGYFFLRKRKED